MIQALHTIGLPPAFFAPKRVAVANDSSRESSLGGISNPATANLADIPQADSLDLSDGFYQRTSLSIHSHAHAKLTEDGVSSVDSHTRLRFQYDFQAADGTKIQIRLRANSDFAQSDNGTDAEQSLRIRAKLKVTVVQDQVDSGTAPLLDGSGVSADAKAVIAKALELFRQVTDAAAAAFENSDPLDGDSLIASLVDAFNGLADKILGSFLGLPPELSPGVISGPVDSAGRDQTQPTAFEPAAIEAGPPAVADAVPQSEAIGETAPPAALPPTPEPPSKQLAQSTALDNQDRQQVGQIVLVKLRAQVIQSLTSLTGLFNSRSFDSPDANSAWTGKFFAKFSYQQLSVNLVNPPGTGLDAQA